MKNKWRNVGLSPVNVAGVEIMPGETFDADLVDPFQLSCWAAEKVTKGSTAVADDDATVPDGKEPD